MAPEELHSMLSSVLNMCTHTWAPMHNQICTHTKKEIGCSTAEWCGGRLSAYEALSSRPTGKGNGGGEETGGSGGADKR